MQFFRGFYAAGVTPASVESSSSRLRLDPPAARRTTIESELQGEGRVFGDLYSSGETVADLAADVGPGSGEDSDGDLASDANRLTDRSANRGERGPAEQATEDMTDGRRWDRVLFVTIKRRTIILAILAIVLAFLAACAAVGMPRVRRITQGARPGVTVNGVSVGGLYADEVRSIVLGFAAAVERAPRPAMYYSETGEIIPEEAGVSLDVDGTVNSVMAAARGARVGVMTRPVAPAVTGQMLKPVYRVKTSEKAVALAFNVAWGEEFMPSILDTLAQANARSTFFITGTWARMYPDLTQLMVSAGHEIANHGYDHPHPEKLGEQELVSLIEKNETLLREITGVRTTLFAPPYGEVNQRICAAAARLGYSTIMWTVDTIDWQRPDPQVIAERAQRRLEGGNIILVHPTDPTARALPGILADLSAKGFRAVTVSELLAMGEPLHDR